MDRNEFKYFRCINCKKIIIVPLKTIDNLGHMCSLYNEIETCCDKPRYLWGDVQGELNRGSIKESDLPEALREKTIVEFKTSCGTPYIFIKRGNKKCSITVSDGKIKISRYGCEIYNENIF